MSTMWGADADALDALAGQVRASGRALDATQVRLGRSIHASPWNGPNADRFRQQWDGEYRRSMLAASSFLDEAGDALEHNADQQRHASGTDGDAAAAQAVVRDLLDDLADIVPGDDPEALLALLRGLFPTGDVDDALRALLGDIGSFLTGEITSPRVLAGTAIGLLSSWAGARYLVKVSGYTKAAGTEVAKYVRFRPGEAAAMKRVFGSAKNLSRILDFTGPVIDGGWSAWSQWQRDAGMDTDERAVRAGAVGAVNFGVAYGAGAVGMAVGGPVGFAVGAGIGLGYSYLNSQFDIDGKVAAAAGWAYDELGDAGGAALDWGGDRVEDVVDKGKDVLDGGKKIISGGADLAKKGVSAVNPFD